MKLSLRFKNTSLSLKFILFGHRTPLYNMEHTDELSIIGHIEALELTSIVSSSMLYIHRFCLEFTPPFQDQVASASTSDEEKDQLEEARVKGIVSAALARKCAFCTRHGASIPCKVSYLYTQTKTVQI